MKKGATMPEFIVIAVILFIILAIIIWLITQFTGFGSEEFFKGLLTKMAGEGPQ